MKDLKRFWSAWAKELDQLVRELQACEEQEVLVVQGEEEVVEEGVNIATAREVVAGEPTQQGGGGGMKQGSQQRAKERAMQTGEGWCHCNGDQFTWNMADLVLASRAQLPGWTNHLKPLLANQDLLFRDEWRLMCTPDPNT